MAIGDVFRVVFKATLYNGQQQLNRWYMRQLSGGAAAAPALLEAVELNFLPALAGITLSSVTFDSLETQNLADFTDYGFDSTLGLTPTGARGGEGMPAFVCATFKQRRPYPPLRNGYKRFSGIPEADWNNGVLVASGANYTAVSNFFNTDLTAVGSTFRTVVARVVQQGFSVTITNQYDAQGWAVNTVAGTQDTRKLS